MKSRLTGCGFGSSRLLLLATSPSISTGQDAGVARMGVPTLRTESSVEDAGGERVLRVW